VAPFLLHSISDTDSFLPRWCGVIHLRTPTKKDGWFDLFLVGTFFFPQPASRTSSVFELPKNLLSHKCFTVVFLAQGGFFKSISSLVVLFLDYGSGLSQGRITFRSSVFSPFDIALDVFPFLRFTKSGANQLI